LTRITLATFLIVSKSDRRRFPKRAYRKVGTQKTLTVGPAARATRAGDVYVTSDFRRLWLRHFFGLRSVTGSAVASHNDYGPHDDVRSYG